jgi:hypothetical protein
MFLLYKKFHRVFIILMSKQGFFNKRNLVKILIIFIVGFSSRILVNHFFDVNVFVDCFSIISTTYYFCIAIFVVAVNHLVELDFSNFIDLLSFESIKPFRQFIYHFRDFFSHASTKWFKPVLFQPVDYRGKGKGVDFSNRDVEVVKFKMSINSKTGSANFADAQSSKDRDLYSTKSGSNSSNTPSTMTPLIPSQNKLPGNGLTEEKWAIWCQRYNNDNSNNQLRSSNLPRSSSDSSFYSSNFTNDTAHSTIGSRPSYSEQNIRDYIELKSNLESRRRDQIIIQNAMCPDPNMANRFSVSTEEEVRLKFKDKIKRDLYRFFSLNGKSTVEGGGWKKGGRRSVLY